MEDLKFSKKKQLYKKEEINDIERDKRFRRCMMFLDFFYSITSAEFRESLTDNYKKQDLHHINGKGVYQLRYGLGNVQFLDRERHCKVHNTEKADTRCEELKNFIKSIDFTE